MVDSITDWRVTMLYATTRINKRTPGTADVERSERDHMRKMVTFWRYVKSVSICGLMPLGLYHHDIWQSSAF